MNLFNFCNLRFYPLGLLEGQVWLGRVGRNHFGELHLHPPGGHPPVLLAGRSLAHPAAHHHHRLQRQAGQTKPIRRDVIIRQAELDQTRPVSQQQELVHPGGTGGRYRYRSYNCENREHKEERKTLKIACSTYLIFGKNSN